MATTIKTTLISFIALSALAIGCAAAPEDESPANEQQPVNVTINEDVSDAPEGENDLDPNAPRDESVSNIGLNAAGMNCSCPAGQQFQNGLCYPACQAGWSGEGPVCWQPCVAGFTDTGWFCQRNSHVTSANTSKCPWYNKCGLGSSCSKCPSGYKNDGCTCRRDAYIYAQPSYGRGAGTTPSCSTY
jgi:hypothetical protein